ncbi:toll/interleukin-1 receptor domain-containing protein [Streptomyces sp. NPDC050803]|uniref:toll/interleukin-1 receptor domain-containing protein n=1 Tax=unclassified Streptomyces TaxID=2593676 RepID=UPI00343DE338
MDPAAFFYTSCVRADGWRTLTRFHTDLEYQLRVQEGFGVSGVLGALMEPESARDGDVTRAGVMLALYSPKYFRDRGAGLEWSVMRLRMRHHEDSSGMSASGCLIPLCWKPMREGDEVPESVRNTVEQPSPFDWLRQDGLESLLAATEAEADAGVRYYGLVEQLAKAIAEAGRTELERLDVADARTLEPAFGESVTEAGQPAETGAEGWPLRWADIAGPETPERERGSVAISYVGADQPWADWMSEVLKERGHEVTLRRWRVAGESLRETVRGARAVAERVLVIFSRSYFSARETEPAEWADAFREPPDRATLPVFVQIDGAPRPLLVRGAEVVVLAGADLAEAEQLIDEVLPEASQRSEERGGGR